MLSKIGNFGERVTKCALADAVECSNYQSSELDQFIEAAN